HVGTIPVAPLACSGDIDVDTYSLREPHTRFPLRRGQREEEYASRRLNFTGIGSSKLGCHEGRFAMTAGEKIVVSKFRHFFETADGPVQATDTVDLAIRAGEFVTLVGPSGCGKTTLLKAIAGFIRPSEGAIECDGKPVRGPGRERGVVFQELAILPWRTVRRNIGHGLEIMGLPRAERERRVRGLIELIG